MSNYIAIGDHVALVGDTQWVGQVCGVGQNLVLVRWDHQDDVVVSMQFADVVKV